MLGPLVLSIFRVSLPWIFKQRSILKLGSFRIQNSLLVERHALKPSLVLARVNSGNMSSVPEVSLDEDDDEQLKRAIALSLQAEEDNEPQTHKRKISASPQQSDKERLPKKAKPEVIDLDAEDQPCLPTSTLNNSRETTSKVQALPSNGTGSIQYPHGVIKRTWAFGYERQNDIKIEEVIQKRDLSIAILSAFQWDIDWVLSKIETRRTRMVFVMGVKGKENQDQWTQDAQDIQNLKLCFPDMSGQINCMHSKLMILVYPSHLRIAIPTANLTRYDWGETGVMENSVFLVDLPRKPDAEVNQNEEPSTNFGKDLLYYLKAMNIHDFALRGILKFDFSATEHLEFVHTIGGSHTAEKATRTGCLGLSRSVQRLNLNVQSRLELDYAAPSIGALNDKFLEILYAAAMGRNPATTSSNDFSEPPRNHFRIYFPTHETVANSKGGVENGGTNCLQSKWYYSEKFPKNCLRDYKSIRPGLLSHNKILLARGHRKTDNTNGHALIAWVYIGSSNLSESAWGKLTTERGTRAPKLNCRNWECGVMMAIPKSQIESFPAEDGIPPIDVFKGYVDIPFKIPGQEYQGRRPWFFEGN